MKKAYKNKKEFWKAEALRYAEEATMWQKATKEKQEVIEKLKKPKEVVKMNVKWFCTQCRIGDSGAIPRGNIEDYKCPSCGANKLLAAAKFPFDI